MDDDWDQLVNWKDPQASTTIAVGAAVRVVGLAKAAAYNGSIGVVVPGGSTGRRVLALAGNEVEVWDAEAMALMRTMSGHAGPVKALAISSDGSKVASGSNFPDCSIKVWDVETGLVVFDWKGHTGRHGCSCQTMAPCYGLKRADPHCPLDGHEASVSGLGFTADGVRLVSVSSDQHLKVWNTVSGALLNKQKPLRARGWIFALAMAPENADLCASGGEDGIHMWDLAKLADRCHIREKECGNVSKLSFCASGKLLASMRSRDAAGPDLWTLDGKKHSTVSIGSSVGNAPFEVSALASSDCNSWIALGSASGGVVVWDIDTSSATRQHLPSDGDGVAALAFDSDGKSLVWATGDQTLRRWNGESDSPQAGRKSRLQRVLGACVAQARMPHAAALAVAMTLHPRLGSDSLLREAGVDVVQKIVAAFPGISAAAARARCTVQQNSRTMGGASRTRTLTEDDGERFLLSFGAFRFRTSGVAALQKAVRAWCRETLNKEVSAEVARKWVEQKHQRFSKLSEGDLDLTRLLEWGMAEDCGLSTRELWLVQTLGTFEMYTRKLLSGAAAHLSVRFEDLFYVTLSTFLEGTATDPITDPLDDLLGGEDPDCFVVESLRDYARLKRQPQAQWPSDALLERFEIKGGGAGSGSGSGAGGGGASGGAAGDCTHRVLASFPGELRLVVDWQRARAFVDCILLDAAAQARICASEDHLEMAKTLLSCDTLRFAFRLHDVTDVNEVLMRFTDSPLRGYRELTLSLRKPPTCTRRRLHSAENQAARPGTPCALPEALRGLTECSMQLRIPRECGEQEEGFERNVAVVARLVGAIEECQRESVEREDESDDDDGAGASSREERAAFVKVHPRDSRTGLHACILVEHPEDFRPRVNPCSGMAENWGLEDGSWEASPMRTFEVQSLYSFGGGEWGQLGPPEQQFTRALVARKRARMAAQKPRREHLFARDLVLRATLVRRPTEAEAQGAMRELEPSIWRRVSVSGGLTLRSLHDRVLGPAFGWTRNYHGYFFLDPTDGAVFASRSGLDMMHSQFHFADSLPDEHRLAELVGAEGDKLLYTYDLGDQWTHLLTVEEVRSEQDSTGRSAVLGGAMACPPEDSCGFEGMGPHAYEEHVLRRSRSKSLPRSTQREIARANNISASEFDPHAFDLTRAEERVRVACAGKASVPGGELVYPSPMFGGAAGLSQAGISGMMLPQGRGIAAQGSGSGEGPAGVQSVRVPEKRDPREERVCATCGSPHQLKLCSGCKALAYCSPACQNKDWKGHKAQCKAIAAKKKGAGK